MLLPRGKKEMGQPEVGPGFYTPVMHQLSVPEDPDQWGVDPSNSMTHSVELKAKIKGIGRGKKYNLMAQVIPIYGFGILLYILYIIYKLTCKGKTNKSGSYTTVVKENMGNTIPNVDELARLQERLLQTERLLARTVSGKRHCSGSRGRRSKTTVSKKEEKLLKQLRQITQLMQEGRLEGASPEMEAEEVPYDIDWEGYPEETYPEYDESCERRLQFETIRLEVPPKMPTAEALAERMEQEEEEVMARKLSIVLEEDEEEEETRDEEWEDEEEEVVEEEEDMEEVAEEMEDEEEEEEEEEAEKRHLLSLPPQPATERKQEKLGLEVSKELQCLSGMKKQISFSDHEDVFHYPKEDTYEEEEEEVEEKEEEVEEEDEGTEVEEEEDEGDEEDPVMEAESLQFSCGGSSNPEEEAEENNEEYLLMLEPVEGDGRIHADVPKDVGVSGLRMRNRRQT